MSDGLDIADNGWAEGCRSCLYGIIAAPELTGACEFYLERLVQALNGDITFCECRAGRCYRVNLLNKHRKFVEEARKDPRMIEQVRRGSHPDLEAAQVIILSHLGKMHPNNDRVPTIRFVEEPAVTQQPVPTGA